MAYTDKNGREVVAGDHIHMPGVPFVVTVLSLVECEDGCQHGAAGIKDPESGALDEVCLGQFEIIDR